jgi:hypothetical protein
MSENMEVINKNVRVHTCTVKRDPKPRDMVESGVKCVGELGIGLEEQKSYSDMPKSCRCRMFCTSAEATEFVKEGAAVWVLKFERKRGEVVLNDKWHGREIWRRVVRERVPRVDLISRADIERAFIGSEVRSKHFIFNKVSKKFEPIRVIPEGMTKKDWMEDALKEAKFEKRIRDQFRQYIDECHKVTMDFRAKLIVPFQEDPFEGRTIFAFGSEQRTEGGYSLTIEKDCETISQEE